MITSHGHEQQRRGECSSWRVKDGQWLRSARAGETKVICSELWGEADTYVWMMAGLGSHTWPKLDCLDSGV